MVKAVFNSTYDIMKREGGGEEDVSFFFENNSLYRCKNKVKSGKSHDV